MKSSLPLDDQVAVLRTVLSRPANAALIAELESGKWGRVEAVIVENRHSAAPYFAVFVIREPAPLVKTYTVSPTGELTEVVRFVYDCATKPTATLEPGVGWCNPELAA